MVKQRGGDPQTHQAQHKLIMFFCVCGMCCLHLCACPHPSPVLPAQPRSRVLLLPHFLGGADDSPFHDIVRNCEEAVFESKLMRLAVQCKWQTNVWPKMRQQIVLYAVVMLLATVATVTSSRLVVDDWRLATGPLGVEATVTATLLANLLVAAMAVAELCALGNELLQLTRMGLRNYVSPWNAIDCAAPIALLLGAKAHFDGGAASGVRTFGAAGVALKWLGFVDYTRCFASTGSLVRMVIVIIKDIGPFLVLLALCLMASALFFVINDPFGDAFGMGHDLGPMRPLVSVFLSMLGLVELGAFRTGASVGMLCLFLFLVVVVMLNMLIAIMADSYEKVKENEKVHALHERATMVVDMELQHPGWHTFSKYMHVAEAADEDSAQALEWEGITGRVKQLLRKEVADVTGRVDRVNDKVEEVRLDVTDKMDEVADWTQNLGTGTHVLSVRQQL